MGITVGAQPADFLYSVNVDAHFQRSTNIGHIILPQNQESEELSEIVDYKTRKRVAKKVIDDLHEQVREIEDTVEKEKQFSRFLIPLLVVVFLVLMLVMNWPEMMRLVSAYLN